MTNTAVNPALNVAVAEYARKGYTVTDRTPEQVILQRKRKVSALKILVLVLLACTVIGLFLIPAVLAMFNRKMETVVLTLDARGKVIAKRS